MPHSAAPKDPAGLLDRLPELRPLCVDRWVRRAVATGKPFKVYRALFLARLTGRLGAHRRELDKLLRTRRAFARPLRERLYLGSWNGLGATLLGRAEAEPDGTRIATHALEFLFGIPIFPLGAYVVRKEAPSGLDECWRIYARVPLGAFAWAWSRGVALAALLAVGAAAIGSFHGASQDVVVVNGFGQPVHVTIGSMALDVPAGQHRAVRLPVGTQPARAATPEGEVVDEGPLEVQPEPDLLVWNVAGVAPVMEREVRYVTETVPDGQPDPETVFHCGERWLAFNGVDFAFVDPPRRLTDASRGEPTAVVRRAVQVARQAGVDGALLCALLAVDHGKDWPAATAILERRARAARWGRDAVEQAAWAARHVSADEEQRILKAARDAHPDEVEENPPSPPPAPALDRQGPD